MIGRCLALVAAAVCFDCSAQITPPAQAEPAIPVIALIGDSTMTDHKGWGGAFGAALRGQAVVHNFAASGRSAKSYSDEGRLPAALAVRPDYVLIQFGHNGQPGKGPQRETDPNHSYRHYLQGFLTAIRDTGAQPVIVSSMTRRNFDEAGRIRTTLGPWAASAQAIASEHRVDFIDLHSASIAYHNRVGEIRGMKLDYSPGDRTHLSSLGASVITGLIFDQLQEIRHPLGRLRPQRVYVDDCSSLGASQPCVSTLGEALGLAPLQHQTPFVIDLGTRRFVEKVVVDKPGITLRGAGQQHSIISFADSGQSLSADGKPVGTHGSYTMKIMAAQFNASNLTIENAFDYPANFALADDHPNKIQHPQGVALMIAEGSDRAHFENVTVSGYQDTLFVDAGRSYFNNVRVNGHVDFIFGGGQAVFENAVIESRHRPGKNPTGYVIAPSTHISQPFGFLFLNCRLVRFGAAVPAGSVKLGRPWHPGGNPAVNGAAVFHRCFMDDHVAADGYAKISGVSANGERLWFDLEPDSRMFEYQSSGPGALQGPRRPQLRDDAAPYYTRQSVLGDWTPQ